MWNNINVTHMPESLMPESISMTNMAPLHAASANIKLRRGSGSSHTRQQQKFVLRPNLCDVSHWQQCLTTQSPEITSNQAAVSAPNKLFFFLIPSFFLSGPKVQVDLLTFLLLASSHQSKMHYCVPRVSLSLVTFWESLTTFEHKQRLGNVNISQT